MIPALLKIRRLFTTVAGASIRSELWAAFVPMHLVSRTLNCYHSPRGLKRNASFAYVESGENSSWLLKIGLIPIYCGSDRLPGISYVPLVKQFNFLSSLSCVLPYSQQHKRYET
eukprot:767458-Hanusia_phi.AAC.2